MNRLNERTNELLIKIGICCCDSSLMTTYVFLKLFMLCKLKVIMFTFL